MRLADLGLVRALVGKMTKLLTFEALDLAKVPRLPLAVVGVHFATVQTVSIVLSKDDSAGGCT